jgi:hypothetical protein
VVVRQDAGKLLRDAAQLEDGGFRLGHCRRF